MLQTDVLGRWSKGISFPSFEKYLQYLRLLRCYIVCIFEALLLEKFDTLLENLIQFDKVKIYIKGIFVLQKGSGGSNL